MEGKHYASSTIISPIYIQRPGEDIIICHSFVVIVLCYEKTGNKTRTNVKEIPLFNDLIQELVIEEDGHGVKFTPEKAYDDDDERMAYGIHYCHISDLPSLTIFKAWAQITERWMEATKKYNAYLDQKDKLIPKEHDE